MKLMSIIKSIKHGIDDPGPHNEDIEREGASRALEEVGEIGGTRRISQYTRDTCCAALVSTALVWL